MPTRKAGPNNALLIVAGLLLGSAGGLLLF